MNLLHLFQNWCLQNDKPILDNYNNILKISLNEIEPCYSKESYFIQFKKITSNRTHFAIQQINSAIEESFGARRLIELVEELPENKYNLGVKFLAHAKEEVFHFTLFINMFNRIFSDISVSPELKEDLEQCTPTFPDEIISSDNKTPYSRVLA